MSDSISMQISIPSDNEGFILLRCSYCGELFKITVSDLNDDSVLNIWCPCCGLISDSYLTQEVIKLAQTKLRNLAMDMVYDSFKQLERKNTSKSPVKIKTGKRPKREHENPIHSRIDLKIIMNEFNARANRLMQAAFNDYMNVLKKFVKYLETTEIIKEYIESCGGYNSNIEDDVEEVASDYDSYFSLGDTEEDEVIIVYSVIKYISEKYEDFPIMIIFAYSDSKQYADKLKAFNDRFVFVLINDISKYLTEVGIRMGLNENVVYNVNCNQVNIANDNATINAVQNNSGMNTSELEKLILAMRNELNKDLSSDDMNEANESIDIIEAELASGQPDEEKVKAHFKLLKRIDGGVKFASACCSLLTMADKIYPFLSQIVPWFQSL